mgnify:CR=1 FL=1
MPPITIHHFSDVLCIWAYIAEARIDELKANFGEQIEFDFRTLSIFGNVPGKMQTAWAAKGGLAAYAQHVQEVADRFEHLHLHPDVWNKIAPASSLPGHLYVAALKVAEQDETVAPKTAENFLSRLRTAFFQDAQDIGQTSVLRSLLAECQLPVDAIATLIASGAAYAQLAEDLQLAKEQDVRSSPTLIFNEGRQRLTGNVGYRIIEANIRELLERPAVGHSWC